MGYAIAEAASEAGYEVDLVTGPVAIPPPSSPLVETVSVETARQMYEAVEKRIALADVAILSAAVSDYRPVEFHDQKIKKTQDEAPVIALERTEDILGSCRNVFGFTGVLVGFAAETEKLAEYATGKLERKKCDLIVANDVSRSDIGFDSASNEIVLFFSSGEVQPLTKAPKSELARQLIHVIEGLVKAAKGEAKAS